jgi:hypothetical protein
MNQQPTARVCAPTVTTDSATTVINEERQEIQRLRYENRVLRSGAGYEDPAYVARILMEKDAEIERLRKVLNFTAGYISAMPEHSNSPPDEIMAWLEYSALEQNNG